MEIITSFFATTPMFIYLIPVILILVVLLVVLNKSHTTTEVIAQVPVSPVTTTPIPPQNGEVVVQEIPSVTAPATVVAEAQPVVTATVAPVEEAPAPAPITIPVAEVVAPVAEVQAPPVAVSFRPTEPVASVGEIIDETPVVEEVSVNPVVEQNVSEVVESASIALEVAPEQSITGDVVDALPVVEVEAPAIAVLETKPTV